MQTENSSKLNDTPWYRLLPAILYAALPMITPEGLFPNARMWAVLAPALLALLLLIADALRKKLHIRGFIEYAPMACYLVMLAAAFIFCSAENTAVLGAFEDAQSFLIKLSFVFMLFYIMNTAASVRSVRWIMGGIFAAVIVLALMDAGRVIKLWNLEGLPDENARLLFISALIPVCATLFVREDRSYLKRRIIKLPLLLIIFAALFAQLFLTDISAGIPAIAAAVLITLLFFTKKLRAWSRALVVLGIVVAVLLTATSKTWPANTDTLGQRLVSGLGRISAAETSPCINSIRTEGDTVSISFGQDGLVLSAEVLSDSQGRISSAVFTDGKGTPLVIEASGQTEKEYIFSDEPYKSTFRLCIIKNHDNYCLQIATAEKSWRFAPSEGGLRFAAQGANSSWVQTVPVAALLLIFLIRCAAQLFWRDPEKLPAGFEAAAFLKGVFAMAAALIMCSPDYTALPLFCVLFGAGTASLDINERFSVNERRIQNGI